MKKFIAAVKLYLSSTYNRLITWFAVMSLGGIVLHDDVAFTVGTILWGVFLAAKMVKRDIQNIPVVLNVHVCNADDGVQLVDDLKKNPNVKTH